MKIKKLEKELKKDVEMFEDSALEMKWNKRTQNFEPDLNLSKMNRFSKIDWKIILALAALGILIWFITKVI